jgi:hypothetical protein
MSDEDALRANEGVRAVSSRPEVTTTRYAFISRLGSVAYVGVTYDGTGGDLPSNVDGNNVSWTRIEASHGEIFALLSTADMERDLQEIGVHVTETRAKPRASLGSVPNKGIPREVIS